jgi:hypothetical protein
MASESALSLPGAIAVQQNHFTEIYIPREWEYLEKSQGSKW